MLIVKVILLLIVPFSVVKCLSSNFEIAQLIDKIHRENNLKTLYIVGKSRQFLCDFLKTYFFMPVLILTNETSEEYVRFGNVLLVVDGINGRNNELSVMLENVIASLDIRKYVIVSANNMSSMREGIEFFSDRKFTRIFGIIERDVFAYLPYETNKIQKFSTKEQLPNAQKDFNGFAFRTTVQRDIPRTFWYPDRKGQNLVGGTYGQIYINFLRKYNATFKEIILNNSTKLDITTVINATIDDEVDISMNVFCAIKTLDLSYPVRIEKYIIMVALNGYVDPKEYFQRPFSYLVWIYIGLILIYVTFIDVLLKHCTHTRFDVWASFSRVFLTLLQMPPEKPVVSAYSMHVQLTVLAFIIGNIYVIYFTSYLTVHIKIKQFDSVRDLVDHNIRILIPKFEWILIERNALFPKGFDKLVEPTDYDTYFKQLYSMRNTSVAFTLASEKFEFLSRMQSLYEKPLFHITKDVVKPYYLGFLLPFNSPFKEIFSNFIIDIKETGLIQKWETDIFEQSTRAGFKIGVNRGARKDDLFKPLTLDHLRFAWNCLTIGLTISVIVFLVEGLLKGRKLYCNKKDLC